MFIVILPHRCERQWRHNLIQRSSRPARSVDWWFFSLFSDENNLSDTNRKALETECAASLAKKSRRPPRARARRGLFPSWGQPTTFFRSFYRLLLPHQTVRRDGGGGWVDQRVAFFTLQPPPPVTPPLAPAMNVWAAFFRRVAETRSLLSAERSWRPRSRGWRRTHPTSSNNKKKSTHPNRNDPNIIYIYISEIHRVFRDSSVCFWIWRVSCVCMHTAKVNRASASWRKFIVALTFCEFPQPLPLLTPLGNSTHTWR